MQFGDKIIFWTFLVLLIIFAELLKFHFQLPVTPLDVLLIVFAPIVVAGLLYNSATSLFLRGKTIRVPRDAYKPRGMALLRWLVCILMLFLAFFGLYQGMANPFKIFSAGRHGDAHGYSLFLYGLVCITIFWIVSGLDQFVAKKCRKWKKQYELDQGDVLRCPECRLISPVGSISCDCGYNFAEKTARSKERIKTPRRILILEFFFLLYFFHMPLFLILVGRPAYLANSYSNNKTLSVFLVGLVLVVAVAFVMLRHHQRTKIGLKSHTFIAILVATFSLYLGMNFLDSILGILEPLWPILSSLILN